MLTDPESAKKFDNFTVFFALSGSAHVKAAHITLMKLTPGIFKCKILTYEIVSVDVVLRDEVQRPEGSDEGT
jgi:hypothetical protein